MTAQPAERSYAKLLAPRGDGELLLHPGGRQFLRDTWDNLQRLRGADAKIGGVPVHQVRRWMRRWIGHREDDRPIIATGHQTELYHPGVWVKNAAIAAAAERIGASAFHFAVDMDAPKHLVYRWPGGGQPLSDDPAQTRASWSGLVKPPSREHVMRIAEESRAAAETWSIAPCSSVFFDRLSRSGDAVSVSEAITSAHGAADAALGLKYQTIIASTLTRSTAYLLFVHDICARADEYARVYNAALARFRRIHGIASPGRPMPDLSLDDEFCEVPFWLDDLADGQRKRASVVKIDGMWCLNVAGEIFRFDPSAKDAWQQAESFAAWLAQMKLRLAPRALTLTSFLRLAVVDQFVHGIGGAIYDQVTDSLLQDWYGMEPPAFSVATVTLFYPAAAGRERTCVECVARDLRRARHAALGERKMQLVGQIAASPRRSPERAMLFSQMHRELDSAIAQDSRVAEQEERYAKAREDAAIDKMLFDRELPYTVQSEKRLADTIARVREAFQ